MKQLRDKRYYWIKRFWYSSWEVGYFEDNNIYIFGSSFAIDLFFIHKIGKIIQVPKQYQKEVK